MLSSSTAVVDLTEILRDLKRNGYLIAREDVAALSPYMTSHIKRFGDYLIDLDIVPQTLDEIGAFILTYPTPVSNERAKTRLIVVV